ncbi:unnamed protein product [Cunninghamella blakesleeana]
MNQIYKNANYILAIPGLHFAYLLRHLANKETLYLIRDKYKEIIYNEIFNNKNSPADDTINNDIDDIKSLNTTHFTQQQQQEEEEETEIKSLKGIYQIAYDLYK